MLSFRLSLSMVCPSGVLPEFMSVLTRTLVVSMCLCRLVAVNMQVMFM